MTYSKYRRLREGLLWETDQPPPIKWRPILEVVVGIALLLSLHGWMQYRDARDALHEQRARTQLVAANLAACMNGGGVIDRARNVAHMCGKAIEVPLPGGGREPS